LRLQVFTSDDVFDALGNDWNPLLKNSQCDHIFLTREWLQTWWEAYHPGELLVIVGYADNGELAGIAPWFIVQQGGERLIHTIGCVDVTDYLDIIAADQYKEAFFSALAEHLATFDGFDRLELCNIPERSPTLAVFPEMLKKQRFNIKMEVQEVCPIIPLPGTWDDYLASLGKKQRHELRRKLRRASGKVSWYIVGPEHDLASELAHFLRLMAASSEEKAQFLQDERNLTFFKLMAPRIMAKGWLQLSILTVDGEPAAAYLNFDYNNRILVYNSGQDITRFGTLSPGIVLLAYTIRHAIEQGRAEFDFLRGDEPYKYQMGGQDSRVFLLTAARA